MTSQTEWPAGVIARYLTKAAEITGDHQATVDVKQVRDETTATCRGCERDISRYLNYMTEGVKRDAQKHSETCRAIPRPTPAAGSTR
ncbi:MULTISPECIES: hypothetical protein [unclassified Streptomyces]|uniref:hypothetical protein n=1 Tax=unclassified Streptomyces TaxID=2593676 RepID=UPI001BE59AA5|nr:MULTISPECIES: hypothetical protein [unclassified Streptomyces]MBT2402836.1 hypothetical protein [Streptomyces sp. ISL-21]MBT2454020.1 hypothetical protein [Streptomyces sp. ISL-86]MBT2607205.1 hypothetical protein [Streptomyces sp. ISL-87]